MVILGIETSCDESAASIVKFDKKEGRLFVLANIISSQIDIHKEYGGVIPEIAAREHVGQIIPVIDTALKKAKLNYKEIDYIAVTKGPGLVTSLLSGIETARSLAFAWKKPLIEVNHISGHIYANFIDNYKQIKYPAIILTVSGGHTNLILMDKNLKLMKLIEYKEDRIFGIPKIMFPYLNLYLLQALIYFIIKKVSNVKFDTFINQNNTNI